MKSGKNSSHLRLNGVGKNPSHLRLNGVRKKFQSSEVKWSQKKIPVI